MTEIKGEWKLPKNVRQIGDGSGDTIVYVEDYVITFLEGLSKEGQPEKTVLLGTVRWDENRRYIFVDGAARLKEAEAAAEVMEKYFKGKSAVGWFLSSEETPFVMKKETAEAVLGETVQEDQVLIVHDQQEEETVVFLMEQDRAVRQYGYYIYYEKNVPMREYLIAQSSGKSVEKEEPVKDDAIRRFRKIVKKKNEKKEEQEKKKKVFFPVSRISYLVGGGLTVTILALGVTMIYNYDRMKEVERNLAMLTNNIDSQSQYLDENNTTQVMLHLENEMTDMMDETENMQTEDMQTEDMQTEDMQTEDTRTEDAGAAAMRQGEVQAEENAGQTEMQGQEGADVQSQAAETDKAKETASASAQAGRASYTVKNGDTLAGISEMYYGSLDRVEEICALNGIDDENTILPGQKILLP